MKPLRQVLSLPLLLLLAGAAYGADRKQIFPPSAKPIGPYSPGILAGDYLYVSGQGASDSAGQRPATIEAQTRQCLDNIKAIVEAAGLTMANVVYAQVYLSDMRNSDAVNKVYANYFGTTRPARAMVGVTRMPTDTPVEIAAVAANTPGRPITLSGGAEPLAPSSPIMRSGDRLYVSGVLSRRADTNRLPAEPAAEVEQAFRQTALVLKSAKRVLNDFDFVTIYYTPRIPREVVEAVAASKLKPSTHRSLVPVAMLPAAAHIEITGIIGAAGTYYATVQSGPTEEALNALKADLQSAGFSMSQVVASNVYLDNIDNFATMNKAYATFFPDVPPTRTTVQPTAEAPGKPNLFSVIAAK